MFDVPPDSYDAQKRAHRSPWRKIGTALGVLSLLTVVGGVMFLLLFHKSETESKRTITQVTVLRPPPPPPPPPKPPERPPEPQKIKEEVKIDQPKPVEQPQQAPADAPPQETLGVDAAGSGGGDGFGLAARQGGRDITTIGNNAGGGGLSHSMFANGVARFLAQELARSANLRGADFKVTVQVWLSADGRIERAQIDRGSGDAGLDEQITASVLRIGSYRQSAVPQGLPQPLRIRLTSADA
jgi:periplasmic protein TonB